MKIKAEIAKANVVNINRRLYTKEALINAVNNYNSKEYKGVHFEALDLIGKNIYYLEDPSVEAKVVSDNEVEYDNKKYRLTPVTRLIKNIKGTANTSGAYQGAKYWGYKGESIYSLMLQLDIDSDDIESDED